MTGGNNPNHSATLLGMITIDINGGQWLSWMFESYASILVPSLYPGEFFLTKQIAEQSA